MRFFHIKRVSIGRGSHKGGKLGLEAMREKMYSLFYERSLCNILCKQFVMKETKQLFTLFEQYAHAQSYSTAFSDLLDHFLIAFKYYENEEAQDKALNQLATHKKKEVHVALLTEIGELAEDFNDPLGELFEHFISKGKNGQFFTPTPVANLLGLVLSVEGMEDGQSISDPACGSGRMLLMAAKINRHLRFYGTDIDELCCKIALSNMMLHSLTGEIAHMDTITNSFYRGFKTGIIKKDGYFYPYYVEFTNPEKSYIWLRPTNTSKGKAFDMEFEPIRSPLMSRGVQCNLFE